MNWRLINTINTNGAMQMAIDEAIAKAVSEGRSPNTLRLYTFDPPTITVGFSQHIGKFNLLRVAQNKYSIVRRITGGTAVLHKNDLTYSIVMKDEELPENIVESYKYLSQAIIHALKIVGINAQYKITEQKRNEESCYLNDNPYDIIVNNKKISGNAQAKVGNARLQHGTIICYDNSFELVDCLNLSEVEKQDYLIKAKDKVTSIEGEIGKVPPLIKLEEAMIKGFKELLKDKNVFLINSSLSEYEQKVANELYRTKYSNAEWLKKK